MLTSIAHQENAGKIICLLDALDECEENGRFRLAQALNKLYKIESSGSVLKFLITSRPYASIQREFQTLENERPTIHLQGENQTEVDKISQEINVVIKHKVEALSSELTLQSYEKTRLHLRLTSIPHRTYLWVYLTFEALRAYNGFNLEDMTHHLPQTVDEAYESILKKSYNAKQARKLLHIVLSASRPLTLHEMFLALGRRHDAVLHGDIQIELTGRFRRKVRDLCGLFVIIVDSKVYLLHQTAREFLLRKQLGDHKLQWGGSFRLQESNHILATICVKYLHTVINDLSNDENQAFLDYSTQNWASHFRDASDQVDGALQQLSLQLCDPTSRLCIAWVKRFQATTAAAFPEEPTALILASYFGLYKLAARVLPRDMENLGDQRDYRAYTAVELLFCGLERQGRKNRSNTCCDPWALRHIEDSHKERSPCDNPRQIRADSNFIGNPLWPQEDH
ncbi:hypothetical protein F4803DRAFT_419066 [Xylaria telfairii]|nr:hypothetical protein F4803DRAFT_419066 [Xylaria telfairii]